MKQAQLDLKPFDAERLRDVALRLRALYQSESRERVLELMTPELIDALVADVTRGFHGDVGVVPRQFLRSFVHRLDLIDENPDYDPGESSAFAPADLTPEEQAVLERKKLDSDGDDDATVIPVKDVW